MTAQPQAGPIEGSTARLADWVREITGADVGMGGQDDGRTAGALRLWPLHLLCEPQTRSAGPDTAVTFRVRHLLASAEPPGEPSAFRMLDAVLVAAVDVGEPTLVLEPPDARLWLALGACPRPALLLDVKARAERRPARAPLVLRPLQLQTSGMRPLDGRVLGPSELPVAGMRIEAAGSAAVAYTDTDGRFHLASVPRHGAVRLRLTGRGRLLAVTLEPDFEEPLTIHCTFEES